MTKILKRSIIMLHWPKKSLVMPFYYTNFDQNGPPYQNVLLYGGVSLSISLNLILVPVPYATPKWPIVGATELHLQHLVVLLE